MDNKVYSELVKYANIICFNHADIEGGDLVQDAFIELSNNKNVSFQEYKNKIRSLLIERTSYKTYNKEKTPSKHITDNVCYSCHELKQIGEFRLHKRKGVIIGVYNICKSCQDKRAILYQRKEKGKIYNKEKFNQWVKKNKTKWNRYIKGRRNYDKENITDAYCKKMLYHKYDSKCLNENPNIIQEYRQKVLEKRKRKNIFI